MVCCALWTGSERVSRTNSDGVLLKEAKHINLSLHYLEQVIIALQVTQQAFADWLHLDLAERRT